MVYVVVANKILSLNKRQTFPIVFEVYFVAIKGQQSYSHIDDSEGMASFPLYSLDYQNVAFLGQGLYFQPYLEHS